MRFFQTTLVFTRVITRAGFFLKVFRRLGWNNGGRLLRRLEVDFFLVEVHADDPDRDGIGEAVDPA